MTRELSFERNKTGNLVIIFASVCVVALELWIMSLSTSDLLKIGSGAAHPLISLFLKYPTLVRIIAAVAIFFALTLGIIHTWKDHLDKTPGLLLNAAGLTDAHYDHKESLGPIPWSEIVNFHVDSSNNRPSLVVDLANPSKYLQVGTLNRRTNSKRHMDEYGSPIVIGSRHLKLDLIKVEESCKSILLAYKNAQPYAQAGLRKSGAAP